MGKGFWFDLNRCTGCGACIIACSTENHDRQTMNWREVYTFNEAHHPALPLYNLSMACNHCELPACVRGCPAGAISRETETGAVRIDPERCLGCKYCTWACPYDAPRYNESAGVTEKCDFCVDRLKKNEAPACVCACPTNALRLRDLDDCDDSIGVEKIKGFTDAGLQPSIRFKPLRSRQQAPQCTAPPLPEAVDQLFLASQNILQPRISLKSEWTLLTFTSIAFILVALLTASVMGRLALNPFVFLGIGGVGMGLSSVHLGKKNRMLFAIRNFKTSWLSREIVLFSAFLGLGTICLIFLHLHPLVKWLAVLVGFLSLFAVDRIYQVAIQATPLNFHSAHTLLNGLYLTGALTGNLFLFALPGLFKLFFYVYRKWHFVRQHRNPRFLTSILRISSGFILPIIFLITNPGVSALLILAVLIGELTDRTEYYAELDIVTPRKQMLSDLEYVIKNFCEVQGRFF